eukprot:CFRG1115T1
MFANRLVSLCARSRVYGHCPASFSGLRLYSTPVKVSTKLLSKLRKETELSMSKCKEALLASSNDYDNALHWLQERLQADGAAKSAKLEGRTAAEGLVGIAVSDGGETGVMVEINCETDFVSKNTSFRDLVTTAASRLALTQADPLGALKMSDGDSLQQHIDTLVGKLGEKINPRRSTQMMRPAGGGIVAGYVHGSKDNLGKIAALVSLSTPNTESDTVKQLARQIASHVVGMSPQTMDELLSQAFLFNPDLTVRELLDSATETDKLDGPLELVQFERMECGEGIEKKVENFADEVAKQMQK